jgi:dihydrodipicolinate synthase/N-acetylneuraminate lyase
MPHLQDGAIGGTNSVAIVAPKLTNEVFKAAKEKNWTRAWTAFRELWPVMMTLYNPEYHGRAFKEALYMMGIFNTINFCDVRQPLSKEEKENLRKNLLNAGVQLIR